MLEEPVARAAAGADGEAREELERIARADPAGTPEPVAGRRLGDRRLHLHADRGVATVSYQPS